MNEADELSLEVFDLQWSQKSVAYEVTFKGPEDNKESFICMP